MSDAFPLADLQLLQHLCSICRIIMICLEACNYTLKAICSTSTALPLIPRCSMVSDTCCSLCVPLEGLECWLQRTGQLVTRSQARSREWCSQAGQVGSSPALGIQPECLVLNLWVRRSAPSLAPAPSTSAASTSAPPAALGFDVLPSDCWHVTAGAAQLAVQGSDERLCWPTWCRKLPACCAAPQEALSLGPSCGKMAFACWEA